MGTAPYSARRRGALHPEPDAQLEVARSTQEVAEAMVVGLSLPVHRGAFACHGQTSNPRPFTKRQAVSSVLHLHAFGVERS